MASIDARQKLSKTKLLKWKLKVTCKNIIGKALAFFTYGKPIRLNFQMTFNPNQHFHIPELGIDGDYLHTFQKPDGNHLETQRQHHTGMSPICRHPATSASIRRMPNTRRRQDNRNQPAATGTLHTPHQRKTAIRDVFVLTDDYRLFEQVQTLAPDIHWYTLCSPNEQGYVNSAFTQTTKELKQKQMARFLCSIQLLMDASVFIGSITTGPSLFLLKKFYPEINPADCLLRTFRKHPFSPFRDAGEWPPNLCKET